MSFPNLLPHARPCIGAAGEGRDRIGVVGREQQEQGDGCPQPPAVGHGKSERRPGSVVRHPQRRPDSDQRPLPNRWPMPRAASGPEPDRLVTGDEMPAKRRGSPTAARRPQTAPRRAGRGASSLILRWHPGPEHPAPQSCTLCGRTPPAAIARQPARGSTRHPGATNGTLAQAGPPSPPVPTIAATQTTVRVSLVSSARRERSPSRETFARRSQHDAV